MKVRLPAPGKAPKKPLVAQPAKVAIKRPTVGQETAGEQPAKGGWATLPDPEDPPTWQGEDGQPLCIRARPHVGRTKHKWSDHEVRRVREIGERRGCWTCGSKDPGTPKGNFVCDHYPFISDAEQAAHKEETGEYAPQVLLPQCQDCSNSQGGAVMSTRGSVHAKKVVVREPGAMAKEPGTNRAANLMQSQVQTVRHQTALRVGGPMLKAPLPPGSMAKSDLLERGGGRYGCVCSAEEYSVDCPIETHSFAAWRARREKMELPVTTTGPGGTDGRVSDVAGKGAGGALASRPADVAVPGRPGVGVPRIVVSAEAQAAQKEMNHVGVTSGQGSNQGSIGIHSYGLRNLVVHPQALVSCKEQQNSNVESTHKSDSAQEEQSGPKGMEASEGIEKRGETQTAPASALSQIPNTAHLPASSAANLVPGLNGSIAASPGRPSSGPNIVSHPAYIEEELTAYKNGLPGLACSNCAMSGECPEYKEGAGCYFDELFSKLPIRDLDAQMAYTEFLLEWDRKRTLRSMLTEQCTAGGQLDPRVSQQLDAHLARIRDFHARAKGSAPRPVVGSTTLTARGPGLLAALFGGAMPAGSSPSPVIPLNEPGDAERSSPIQGAYIPKSPNVEQSGPREESISITVSAGEGDTGKREG